MAIVDPSRPTVDSFFVSPTGEITVVEAKLWRNPQARRELIGRRPNLAFSLALVEVRPYRVPGSDQLLVVPSVVGRTREVTRAVIDVRADQALSGVAVTVEAAVEESDSQDEGAPLASYDAFVELATPPQPQLRRTRRRRPHGLRFGPDLLRVGRG
ncbi:MAG: hypothetical protein GY698_05995 [Actinomycetia bacterium]|nr:hypothetical protein [Actinomycetes bacterium]